MEIAPSLPTACPASAAPTAQPLVVLNGASPYVIQRGFLKELGNFLNGKGHERALVVTDEQVSSCWSDKLASSMAGFAGEHRLAVLPAGEQIKTLDTVTCIHRQLLALGADRSTAVVALGGGVVSDVVGLAAATYMRGLPLYLLPSTLLAMVDASIGGKNGVDLPQGKNLIGTFYLPQGVCCDLDLLSTLPAREWSNGLAEALKTAIIGDPELFALLEQLDFDTLASPNQMLEERSQTVARCREIVERSARVKGRIVEQDLTEKGLRAQLNLGHTLGHGLEAAVHYQGISHGEAVALGMLAAVRIAARRGILRQPLEERLAAMYRRWHLPVRLPTTINWNLVELAIWRDKKRRGKNLTLVLPVAVGEVCLVTQADDSWLREAFCSLLA